MQEKYISVVTGANGFVGSHLVDALLQKGYSVRCIVRRQSNLQWLAGKPVDIFRIESSSSTTLENAFRGADYIYHVAGVVKSKLKEGYFSGNVGMTREVLGAAIKSGSNLRRLVIVSSQAAAGPSIDGHYVTEDELCAPITTYGESKMRQEMLAKEYFGKLPVTICRPPAVYGDRDTEIFVFFKTIQAGIAATIGFSEKKLSLIHVRDLVRGLVLAGESETSLSRTYFITSKKAYGWDEIIEATGKAFGKKALRLKIPHFAVYGIAAIAEGISMFSKSAATLNLEKARDITRPFWLCSPERAEKDFGFIQSIEIDDGIAQTTDWYRKHGWLS